MESMDSELKELIVRLFDDKTYQWLDRDQATGERQRIRDDIVDRVAELHRQEEARFADQKRRYEEEKAKAAKRSPNDWPVDSGRLRDNY